MNRPSLLSASALTACIMAVAAPAAAQEARNFNIPAGALRDALNLFATQSDQQIFFTGDLVAGRTTPGLTGRHIPSAALDQLLAGSGLVWSQTRPGVILLRRGGPGVPAAEMAIEIEEVIVTGTLLRTSGELASPVIVLDRDALDRRGFGTVAEALADLPQNYAGEGTPAALLAGADGAGSNSAVSTGVNLRGLGPDATLVLVNGRRLAGTGFRGEFADVSALPSAAVERIDVLLDGASALYGSDAVAGVVNIIMRRSFEGQESRVRVGVARSGGEDFIVSHLGGLSWSSGSALASYEHQTVNSLSSRDRSYTRDGDLRPFGGSDWRTLFSGPGNIVAYDPAVGSYVSKWAIRPRDGGTATTAADFAPGATNLEGRSVGVDLTPDIERHSVYARVRQSLGDRIDLSADLRFSDRSFGFDNAASSTIFDVTAANPHFVSPSGAASDTIAYSFLGDLGPTRQSGASRSLGLTAGGAVDLGRDWSLDGYAAFARERGESRITNRINALFLDEALGNIADNPLTGFSAARDGYFNPYGSGAANSAAILDFIGSGFSGALDESRSTSVNLLLEGPLLRLPAGAIQAALGAQYRTEAFETRTTSLAASVDPVERVTPERDRSIAAVFAEARIPLVAPEMAIPGVRRLELSVAGRLEEYEDFGSTANPKLGLVWSPAEHFAVRASRGTSFRAPALPQVHDDSVIGATLLPRADGSRMLAFYLYGGNPDLNPETADTWTVGFDYARPQGLRLSAGYFDTRFTDRIAQPVAENLSGALTDPSLAPFVRLLNAAGNAADLALVQGYISDPSFSFGALFPPTAYGAVLDGRWVNTASVEVRGLDATASYPLLVGATTLSIDASASYLFAYESRATPTAVVRDLLGTAGYPVKLRARTGLTASRGPLDLDVHWNHVAAYRDAVGEAIDAWNTIDLQLGWSAEAGALAGLRLTLSVHNLFDEDPPFYDSPTGYGFDPGQANLLGRVMAIQLIKRW